MTTSRFRIGAVFAAVIALVAAAVTLPIFAPGATAAARVTVTGTPNADSATQVEVSGAGFQTVEGGFGGVYVLFGWVDDPAGGSWRPSNGGASGDTYRYMYDDESNPAGYQLFVAFPGSSTAGSANGGELTADGTWSGRITIPGAVFQTYDRDLNETTVDCTQVQCGIITVGAHGVKNTNNETFTPVSFSGLEVAAPDHSAQNRQDAAAEEDLPGNQSQSDSESRPADAAAPVAGTDTADVTAIRPPSTTVGESSAEPFGWSVVLLPAAILFCLSLIVLAAGIGGYLATKSLLLGVNPEALEKVRGKRERAALRERERQRRKTLALNGKQENRAFRTRERAVAEQARVEARGQARHGDPQAVDKWLGFFQAESAQPRDGGADATVETELVDISHNK